MEITILSLFVHPFIQKEKKRFRKQRDKTPQKSLTNLRLTGNGTLKNRLNES